VFNLLDYPFLVLFVSVLAFWVAARIGGTLRKRKKDLGNESHEELMFVLGGTLTLLGLIIGFTFSMAVNRYDQRKNYEEQEANAIGTEYVRADLLPAADAAKVRVLLKSYLNQRILYYTTRNMQRRREINAQIARLQTDLWSAVVSPGSTQRDAVAALVLGGMNDVLNSQGYAQGAWWNRIPVAAWVLLALISIFCNLLLGYAAHEKSAFLLLILPIALSISLFLIADIDSPRSGVIHVHPQNLESLAESLRSQ